MIKNKHVTVLEVSNMASGNRSSEYSSPFTRLLVKLQTLIENTWNNTQQNTMKERRLVTAVFSLEGAQGEVRKDNGTATGRKQAGKTPVLKKQRNMSWSVFT